MSERPDLNDQPDTQPSADPDGITVIHDNAAVVRTFLGTLEHGDLDAAFDLLADDIVYVNVSIPAIRGRAKVERALRTWLGSDISGFSVHFEHVATDGDVVMTDRVDELRVGRRFAARVWVYGRFTVRDGRITEWRDYFDWYDVVVGAVRGLAGMASPGLNRQMPE
jgi:limonene-1,2-epoxide hydrolase